jgi:hypothetical protein
MTTKEKNHERDKEEIAIWWSKNMAPVIKNLIIINLVIMTFI